MTIKIPDSPILSENIQEYLKNCVSLKPDNLIIDDIKWKYLIRSVLRGKNILMTGPTGSGKTFAAQSVANSLGKQEKLFCFNLGSMQDARCSLIGNTQYNKTTGTVFNESAFVRAIKTDNSIILLDELSRAHHDAINILITVLDDLQRYLRLDEKQDYEIVKVANGVTFIATANIGNEYTATRVMDRALLGRFPIKIEMLPLEKDAEFNLMKKRFSITDSDKLDILNSIVEIAAHTRKEVNLDSGKLTNFLPTRAVVEMTELILDGFSLLEIAETAIYPHFSKDGGVDSERMFITQLVQKYIKSDNDVQVPF